MSEDRPKPKKSSMRCIVDADLLLRAHLCAGEEEFRPYLQGVNIEPLESGGALLVATDGHKLVALRDPNAFVENGPGIIHLGKRFIAASVGGKRPSPGNYKIVVADGRAGLVTMRRLEPTAEEVGEAFDALSKLSGKLQALQYDPPAIIDFTYVNWRWLLAEAPDEKLPVSPLAHQHLKRLARALCGDSGAQPLRIVSSGAGSPHLVRSNDVKIDGFGMIMPMRADIACDYPDWAKSLAPPKAGSEEPAPTPRARWTRFLGLPIRLQS